MKDKGKTIQVDTKTFVRFWLVILGLGLVALFVWQAATGLLIVGISLFLAIAISPLVNTVAKIIPGNRRKVATGIAYVVVVGSLAAILSIVLPAIINETVRFVNTLPDMIGEVSSGFGWVNDLGNRLGVDDLQSQIMGGINNFSADFVKDFGTNILSSVGAIGAFLAATILILFLTFFILLEGPEIMNALWRNFGKNERMPKLQKVTSRMADVIAKYVSGALMVALINGAATTLVVFILSLIFGFSSGLALPLGLTTGVMCLIPMFGSFIGGAFVAILLAFGNVGAGIAFFAYYIIYMQLEANLISPRIQSKRQNMPALVVLVAVTIGVYMFGLIGAIVAIPIAGCVRVLIEEYGSKNKDEKLAGTADN